MKKRILIVDDDRNALRLMSQALELEDYETILADNGPEALTSAERDVQAPVSSRRRPRCQVARADRSGMRRSWSVWRALSVAS